jgi:hypothetical protein
LKKEIKITIKELKKAIVDLPDEMEIILQKDSEGNGYSPLAVVDSECIYLADSLYSGDVFSTDWTAEDANLEEDEWEDILNNHKRCLVFAPIN